MQPVKLLFFSRIIFQLDVYIALGFRWASQLAFLARLVEMEEAICAYLREPVAMSHRGLSPTEWHCVKEVCAVLELLKHVNMIFRGGREVYLARPFSCATSSAPFFKRVNSRWSTGLRARKEKLRPSR